MLRPKTTPTREAFRLDTVRGEQPWASRLVLDDDGTGDPALAEGPLEAKLLAGERAFDRPIGEHAWAFADFPATSFTQHVDVSKQGVFPRDRRSELAVAALRERRAAPQEGRAR